MWPASTLTSAFWPRLTSLLDGILFQLYMKSSSTQVQSCFVNMLLIHGIACQNNVHLTPLVALYVQLNLSTFLYT